MKINVAQSTLAILDIVIDMAAKQKSFQEVIISYLADDEEQSRKIYADLKEQSDYNLELYRAKILQYAEVSPIDLMNGTIDF